MTARRAATPRPIKSTEYIVVLATREAQQGWRDLCATAKNATADAWDYLTKTPTRPSESCYTLSGKLATFTHKGIEHERWQYKVTSGARIWYGVEHSEKGSKKPGTVLVIRADPSHPNETIKNHR